MQRIQPAKNLVFLLFVFASCSGLKKNIGLTNQWQGSDVPGHTYASFTDFNGKQAFDVKRSTKGSFYLKYTAELKQGELLLKIKSGGHTLLERTIKDVVNDSIKLDDASDAKYKFIFEASKAQGSFDVRY